MPRYTPHRRIAVLALLATTGTSGLASAAAASEPARHVAGGKLTLRFFSELVSTTYRRADGSVAPRPAVPAAGAQLEVSELYFAGTAQHHAKHWSATSDTVCVYKATGAAICDGHAAVGGNQMLFVHTAVDAAGGGDTIIRGGTGRYAGATGSVLSVPAGGINNTNVTLTVRLRA